MNVIRYVVRHRFSCQIKEINKSIHYILLHAWDSEIPPWGQDARSRTRQNLVYSLECQYPLRVIMNDSVNVSIYPYDRPSIVHPYNDLSIISIHLPLSLSLLTKCILSAMFFNTHVCWTFLLDNIYRIQWTSSHSYGRTDLCYDYAVFLSSVYRKCVYTISFNSISK